VKTCCTSIIIFIEPKAMFHLAIYLEVVILLNIL
jgi:hypothetical protein